jgi:ribosome biogenesis GTPase A
LLKKIHKVNTKTNLICERCFKLRNYHNFEDLRKADKATKSEEAKKIENYTLLVKDINVDLLIHQLVARISNKATVLYICDISDIESTIDRRVLSEIAKKGSTVLFIVNKFDILPKDVSEERIKIWVGEMLKDLTKDIQGLSYSYVICSSKNGFNFDYVIYKLKRIKDQAREDRVPRPKLFIIGNTNVGKSSFINKLIQRSNKFLSPEERNKSLYKSSFNPNLLENLTESPLPGTTIGITKVDSMTLGLKLFDTPGIPDIHSITYGMSNYIDIIAATITKKIIPHSMNVKQGYSIWLGGVAKIDFLNGEDKFFSFFLSHNVTIHKTNLLNADDFFAKHIGERLRPVIAGSLDELKLTKHSFNLVCNMFSLLNYDISIAGLGWFSISGRGFMQIDVYVPEGVNVYLRKKPLMPYEIKKGGVKRQHGKTINATSKLNSKPHPLLSKDY